MCDLREGTCNADLEVKEVLLEKATCKQTPEDKQVVKLRAQKREECFKERKQYV